MLELSVFIRTFSSREQKQTSPRWLSQVPAWVTRVSSPKPLGSVAPEPCLRPGETQAGLFLTRTVLPGHISSRLRFH